MPGKGQYMTWHSGGSAGDPAAYECTDFVVWARSTCWMLYGKSFPEVTLCLTEKLHDVRSAAKCLDFDSFFEKNQATTLFQYRSSDAVVAAVNNNHSLSAADSYIMAMPHGKLVLFSETAVCANIVNSLVAHDDLSGKPSFVIPSAFCALENYLDGEDYKMDTEEAKVLIHNVKTACPPDLLKAWCDEHINRISVDANLMLYFQTTAFDQKGLSNIARALREINYHQFDGHKATMKYGISFGPYLGTGSKVNFMTEPTGVRPFPLPCLTMIFQEKRFCADSNSKLGTSFTNPYLLSPLVTGSLKTSRAIISSAHAHMMSYLRLLESIFAVKGTMIHAHSISRRKLYNCIPGHEIPLNGDLSFKTLIDKIAEGPSDAEMLNFDKLIHEHLLMIAMHEENMDLLNCSKDSSPLVSLLMNNTLLAKFGSDIPQSCPIFAFEDFLVSHCSFSSAMISALRDLVLTATGLIVDEWINVHLSTSS
jgi:hypothetical protein